MDSVIEKYPEIGELRRPDKAMVYLINNEELDYLKIKRNNINRNLDKILELAKAEFDLRRGDLIYVQPELNGTNNGKYLYTGNELISPNNDGSIPDNFQVIIEFLPRYWEGRLSTTFVPFNVKKNIGIININSILKLRRFPYFRFIRNGEDYAIISDYKMDRNELTEEEFLTRLNNAQYFSFIPIESKEDYLKLGDWRTTVYLPIKL